MYVHTQSQADVTAYSDALMAGTACVYVCFCEGVSMYVSASFCVPVFVPVLAFQCLSASMKSSSRMQPYAHILTRTATHCNTLQHTATHHTTEHKCNELIKWQRVMQATIRYIQLLNPKPST